ncbi:MAG: zinc ribbon domain-containing protein [Erysipelotrichaceae bacterium]|nr:zinc ribbon domain-containing protein [Erysipelotrichaceae bacterium]
MDKLNEKINKKIEKIMTLDYPAVFKKLIISGIIVGLICAVVTGISLSPQITEVINYKKEAETAEKAQDTTTTQTTTQNTTTVNAQDDEANEYGEKGGDGERDGHGKEHGKDHFGFEGVISQPSMFSKIMMGVTGLLAMAFFAAYWLLVVAFLYKSAAVSNMSTILWPLLGLFMNLGAVVLFFLVRKFFFKQCKVCGKYQRSGKYCVYCGASMVNACPKCGTECETEYCPNCGTKMNHEKEEEAKETEE